MDEKIMKNIVAIAIIGAIGYVGIFVVLPILFTAAIYIIGFIVIVLLVGGLGIWLKEFLDGIEFNSSNINSNTNSTKANTQNNNIVYEEKEEIYEEDIHIVTTYVEALSTVDSNEVNKDDKLYLVIENQNKYNKDMIAVYSRYWYKIGYCNENLSKALIKSMNKGMNYIATVLEIDEYSDSSLELKLRVSKTLFDMIEEDSGEELDSTFITTVVGVTFENRQSIISKLKTNDKLNLVRERGNKYDNNAIAIYNLDNEQIGYCNKALSKSLALFMDKGNKYDADVIRIKGGGALSFGVDIKITKSTSNQSNFEASKEKVTGTNYKEDDGSFLSYVKSLSPLALMSIVNRIYADMKGSSNLVPFRGDYGSIEFAEIMLMWEYSNSNKDKNPELYGDFFMLLAEQIGCAFNHMSAGEWSDRFDDIIRKFPQIMSLSERADAYIYLRDNYATQIRECEFNKTIYDLYVYDEMYMSFIEKYNNMPSYNDAFNYFAKQGLGISRLLNELDSSERLNIIKRKALDGDIKSQLELGKMYLHGVDVFKDNDESIKWFIMAANQGNSEAYSYLDTINKSENQVAENKNIYGKTSEDLRKMNLTKITCDNISKLEIYQDICHSSCSGDSFENVLFFKYMGKDVIDGKVVEGSMLVDMCYSTVFRGVRSRDIEPHGEGAYYAVL